MAGNDKKVNYEVTADPAGFEAGMAKVVTSAQNAQEAVTTSFSKMAGVVQEVQAKLLALTAIIGGGAMFKEQVAESIKWTGEANKLSKALGITATEASVLNVALGDVHTDADTMVSAATKLAKALGENEDKFKELGVETRNAATGGFRPMLDIMLDTNKRLLSFTEGVNRNVEGVKIYGKSWNDVQPVLRLTTDLMEESKKKAQALGLVVGQENVQAAAKYKAAMNDVGDVVLAVKKAVGDALLPILTDLGKEFAETGPDRVRVMVNVMNILIAVFEAVRLAVTVLWEVIKIVVKDAVIRVMTLIEVVQRALKGDFAGAKEAWKRGMDQVVQTVEDSLKTILARYEAAKKKLADLMEGGQTTPTAKKPDGDVSVDRGNGKDKSRMSQWETELNELKLAGQERATAEGKLYKMSLAEESSYWQAKLALTTAGSAENLAVRNKTATLGQAVAKEKFDAEIADLRAQQDQYKHNYEERIAIAQKIYQKEVDTYKAGSKEALAALGEIAKEQRKYAEQTKEVQAIRAEIMREGQLGEIETERQMLQLRFAMGQISNAQLLQREQVLEDQIYLIKQKALQERLQLERALGDKDPVKIQQLNLQLEQLERQHQQRITQLKSQALIEQNKPILDAAASMKDAFTRSAQGILSGQQTLGQGLKSLWTGVVNSIVNALGQILMKWVSQTAAMKALSSALGLSEVSSDSAKAGAGGVASMAAAPFPLNLTAPAFGAEMAALALSYGAMASASGGYDIPAGVNPVTQLHQREMVLPANLADAVRGMTADSGGGDVHLHVHAVDAQSVKRLFRDNGAALVQAMRAQKRNFSSI
jgi:hypothetical protein